MLHKIVLSDGTVISSGISGENAIVSVSLTRQVNTEENLQAGAVCAAMMEATVMVPEGELFTAGEEVSLYQEEEMVGLFRLEKPEKVKDGLFRLTAYDRVTLLDKDLSGWLANLDGWPYTLVDLAGLTCQQCGVVLENGEIPNGDYYVQKFSGEGITGRQIMAWIGQAAGRFCFATQQGSLRFDWYRENPKIIGEDPWYYQGGLSFEEFVTAPIERVQIRQNETDVGTFYPDTMGNTYVIQGNPLLCALDKESLLPVAQTLYEGLKDISYTPCTVSVPWDKDIRAGDIVHVKDAGGKVFKFYVMEQKTAGGRDTLRCSGTPRRDSTAAVNNQTLRQYMGKVLNLSATVDGLQTENKNVQGDFSKLTLDVEGIAGQVEKVAEDGEGLKKDVADLKLSAQSLQLQFQSLREDGVDKVTTATGYTFDGEGLKISKSGQQMENKLDDHGMTVSRSGTPILKATAEGVEATDVKVNNFLMVGRSRFEDYAGGTRTACFYLGEVE